MLETFHVPPILFFTMRILQFILSTLLLLSVWSCQKTPKKSFSGIAEKPQRQMAETNFSEGMKQFVIENYSEAKSWFEKTLSIDGNAAAAHYMLGKLALREQKLSDALEHTKAAIKIETKNRYYYQQLAQVHERQLNLKEAIATYKKLIAEVPNSEEFYYEMATDYIYLKEFDEAAKIYSKIEMIFGRTIELTRQKQQLFLKINKLDLAIDEGNAYLKEFPYDVDMKITQAEILYSNNKAEEAIKYLETVIKQHPTNGEAHVLLMNIYKTKGDLAKFQQQLEYIFSSTDVAPEIKLLVLRDLATDQNEEIRKSATKYGLLAVKHHPLDAHLHEALGDLLRLDKKGEEAYREYIIATSLIQNDFNLWTKLIQTDAILSKPDSLIVHSEKAITYFPNQAIFWLLGGTGYQIKKQCEKAIEWLEEAKRLSINNENIGLEINSRLGDCYQENKQYKKSDQAYEEALKIDNNYDYVLNNYSYYLSLRKERLEDAKQMSEKLIKRHPNEANYLDTHAWVLYMLKDYQGAKKILEVAVFNSTNGTIIEHYGDVLYQLGDKTLALEQWIKAKKLGDTTNLIDKKISDQKLYEE